ncbi:MAG: IS66 family transposase, partial [Planctomycetota bacterium]|nr:IS66 family transposase [Planctomycetota bacterium]
MVREEILLFRVIHVDETPVTVQDPKGKAKPHLGRVWPYAYEMARKYCFLVHAARRRRRAAPARAEPARPRAIRAASGRGRNAPTREKAKRRTSYPRPAGMRSGPPADGGRRATGASPRVPPVGGRIDGR